MSTKKQIISELQAEVEAFLRRHDMYATHLGKLAANNTALVSRIRAGSIDSLELIDSLRRFMLDYDKKKRRQLVRMGELTAA